MMYIRGFLKTTLLDYPGHVASTVFLGGCNMRCPFCHNMDIVTSEGPAEYTDEDILKFLAKRRGIVEGVCITGGEPTICEELPDLVRLIKASGLKVKLDTNGTNPQKVKMLIDEDLVDYVAMDIKSSLPNYARACGIEGIKLAPIKETVDLLIGGKCEYEFRSTMVDELFDDAAIKDIATLLKGAKRYFLQGYVESEFVPDKTLHAVEKEKLLGYRKELLKTIDQVELRGYD